jgi:hypothetical protein
MSYWNNMMDYQRPYSGVDGVLAVWTLIWKGLALWKFARNDERYWFVFFLLPINTAGILEMIYLFVFAKNKLVLVSEPPKSKRSSKK